MKTMKSLWNLRVCIGIFALLGFGPSALAQSAAVSDTTFADANWSLAVFPAGNGGSVTANQATVGANPIRSVSDTVNGTPSTILGTHIYTPFTYNPAASGAISTVAYSENAICLTGCFGQGQSTGPALLQGGVLFIYNGFLITGPGLSFTPLALSGLTAADFSQVAVTTTTLFNNVHPNFSSSGAPIQFGFFRANASGPSVGYTLVAGIDDWQMSVSAAPAAAPPIATPTLDPLAIGALALLLAVGGVLYLRRSS